MRDHTAGALTIAALALIPPALVLPVLAAPSGAGSARYPAVETPDPSLDGPRDTDRADRGWGQPRPAPTVTVTVEPPPRPTVTVTHTVTATPARHAPSTRPHAVTTPTGVWAALADCESSGNPRAVDPTGTYFGLYQFDLATWRSVGGSGYPHHATAEEQLRRAKALQAQRGWQPWPACSQRLGLR